MQYFYSLQTRFCPPPLPGLKLKLLNKLGCFSRNKERKKEKHQEGRNLIKISTAPPIQCTPPRSGLQVTGLFPARLNFTFPSAQQLPACHYRPSLSCSILPKAVTESRPEPNLGRNAKLRTAKGYEYDLKASSDHPGDVDNKQALLLDS